MNRVTVKEYKMPDKTGYESGAISYKLPTEDDLPYDDGGMIEAEAHKKQTDILANSLKKYWKNSRKYYIGGDMFMNFKLNGTKKFKVPDFFLVMNEKNRERKSWIVWQENMRFPDVIIELLSDSTRKTDKKEKKKLYAQVFGTPEYYIYDPFSQEFRGYRLSGHAYKTVKTDRENRIYSNVAGLCLAVRNDRLRWMTEDGYILPSHEELSESERKRAESEHKRAESEKQRAEYAESQIVSERLKAEHERQRAEHAEQRAAMLADKLRQLGVSAE